MLALDNEGYRASQYVEDNKKPYHFKYSEEQKKKTVELTLPPYNIIRRELLKLLQLPYTTVSDWVNQHRKDHNLKTRRQDFQEKKTRVIHLITTENMTQKQAAEEVGVSKNTVSDWMKQYREEHNVPTKQPRHPSQEERNKAIEMFNSGMNAAEIARVLGKSPRTVRDWLQPYNAQARQELHERAMEMFQSSLSVSEISTILEKSTRTIRSWLQSHNTQIRQRLKNKAIKMYKAGISIPEIAKTLQASTHTISNWVHPYKNKYKRYSQRFRDHAAKMFIEYGIGKEAIIDVLNIHISIRTLNIWIGHYKERKQKEETETTSQETNELQDDDSEESDFDQSNDFYSEVDAAIAIVERNLSLRDITEIANKNYFNLELLKLYVRNYRYR